MEMFKSASHNQSRPVGSIVLSLTGRLSSTFLEKRGARREGRCLMLGFMALWRGPLHRDRHAISEPGRSVHQDL